MHSYNVTYITTRYKTIEDTLVFQYVSSKISPYLEQDSNSSWFSEFPKSYFLPFRSQIWIIAFYNRCCLSCRFALSFNLDSLPSWSLQGCLKQMLIKAACNGTFWAVSKQHIEKVPLDGLCCKFCCRQKTRSKREEKERARHWLDRPIRSVPEWNVVLSGLLGFSLRRYGKNDMFLSGTERTGMIR